MDSRLEQYLLKRQEAEAEAQRRKEENGGWRDAIASFGAAASGNVDNYLKRRDQASKSIDEDTVGRVDNDEKTRLAFEKQANDNESFNPLAEKNQAFRKGIEGQFPEIAKAYGDKWQHVTSADSNLLFKPLELSETIKNRAELARQREESSRLREESYQARLAEQEMRRQERQDAIDLKAEEENKKNTPEERIKALDTSGKARFDNALMVLKAIDEMGVALDNGDNTFSLVGDNAYSAASRRATEAFGRLQSGGAINKDEEKRFEKTLPMSTDDKKMQRHKLLTQREEMLSRLKTLGFTPEQIGYQTRNFNYGKTGEIKSSEGHSPRTGEQKKTSPSKVRVSDGKQTLEIDESELADAEKDGFKKVK